MTAGVTLKGNYYGPENMDGMGHAEISTASDGVERRRLFSMAVDLVGECADAKTAATAAAADLASATTLAGAVSSDVIVVQEHEAWAFASKTAAATSASAAAASATAAAGYVVPSLVGNSGKFLKTDGFAVFWATVDALPSQTGNAGKYLTTNGTSASWATVPTVDTATLHAAMAAFA